MEIFNLTLPAIALFGSVLAFWIGLLVLVVTVFVLDFNEQSSYSIGSIVLFIGLIWIWGDISILAFITVYKVSIYFGVGLVYAVFRTYVYGLDELKYNGYSTEPTEKAVKENLEDQEEDRLKNLKGNFLRWWSLWFVSLINWLLTDFIRQFGSWIYDRINIVVLYVYNLGKKHKK